MIRKITRDEYKALLDAGFRFRNWSLYEPERNPERTYYCVIDEKGNCILNKTAL